MTANVKMDHVRKDIDPQLASPSKSATNFIELNVDMNVTVSSAKKSKIFQRSRRIVFFLVAILLAVVLSHLRKEVRTLQVQIQSVNINLLLLMSKYDRLNRSLNRAWIQRSDQFLDNKNIHEVKRLLVGPSSMSRTAEILEDVRNATNKSLHASPVPNWNRMKYLGNEHSRNNDIRRTNTENSEEPIIKVEQELGYLDDGDESSLRTERAILTMEKQSMTKEDDARLDRGSDDDYDDNDLNIWREPRSGRSRRDEGRGKKRGQNKRRPKRSRRRLGPLVATFVGAIPEQHVTDTVYIGPWVKSAKNNTEYSLNKFHLVEDKKSIEVTATGLYMISAQIFYFGEPTNYSYWILLSSEGKSTTQKLVKCSTASSTSATEVSCYTSIITPLQKGDRVHIQQQERDRLINMREGHSYIQLVLLSNNMRRRRLK